MCVRVRACVHPGVVVKATCRHEFAAGHRPRPHACAHAPTATIIPQHHTTVCVHVCLVYTSYVQIHRNMHTTHNHPHSRTLTHSMSLRTHQDECNRHSCTDACKRAHRQRERPMSRERADARSCSGLTGSAAHCHSHSTKDIFFEVTKRRTHYLPTCAGTCMLACLHEKAHVRLIDSYSVSLCTPHTR